MKRSHIIYLLMLFILACDNTQVNEFKKVEFQAVYTTDQLEEIKIPTVLFKEWTMLFTEDFLVSIGDDQDTAIRVFDKETMVYLGGFGERGEGPDQMKPHTSSLYHIKDNKIHIGTYRDNRVYDLVRQTGGKKGIEAVEVDRVRLPGELALWHSSTAINDSFLVGIPQFSKTPIVFFNRKTRESFSPIEYPDRFPELTSETDYVVYQGAMRLTTDFKKAVFTHRMLPLIRIVDLNDHSEQYIEYETQFEQSPIRQVDQQNINARELNTYYRGLQVSRDYIYAVYRPKSSQTKGIQELGNRELHVFSIDGEPVFKLTLKSWMDIFAVDPDDRFLYFWHPEKEDLLYKKEIAEYF